MKLRSVVLCSRDGCDQETVPGTETMVPLDWLSLTLPVQPDRRTIDTLEAFCSLSCLAEWAIEACTGKGETVPLAAVVAQPPPVAPKPKAGGKRRYADDLTTLKRLRAETRNGPVDWTTALRRTNTLASTFHRVVESRPHEFVVKEVPAANGAAGTRREIHRRIVPLEVAVDKGLVLDAHRADAAPPALT